MDEAGIEASGLAPLQADLDRIKAAATKKDIAVLFGAPGFQSTFGVSLPPDLKNPEHLHGGRGSGGPRAARPRLLLEGRRAAERDPHEVRGVHRADARARGRDGREGKARNIMAFETAIARVSWPIEKRRDVDAMYNPRTVDQLVAYAPGFEWRAFLESRSSASRKDLIVGELTAVRDIAKLVGQTPLPR